MKYRLDHVQVAMPRDREADARAFYSEILGFQEIRKPETLLARGGVWYQLEEGRQLHLGVAQNFCPNRKAHPGFIVDDLDGLAQRLENAETAVKWDEALHPVRRFYVSDVFGNRLEFADRSQYD